MSFWDEEISFWAKLREYSQFIFAVRHSLSTDWSTWIQLVSGYRACTGTACTGTTCIRLYRYRLVSGYKTDFLCIRLYPDTRWPGYKGRLSCIRLYPDTACTRYKWIQVVSQNRVSRKKRLLYPLVSKKGPCI
jgi:hypothetical protein